MNLAELKIWATKNLGIDERDNQHLINDGVNPNEIHKVRCCLRSIVDRIERISMNSSENNKWMIDIEDFTQQLTVAKVKMPEVKKRHVDTLPDERILDEVDTDA